MHAVRFFKLKLTSKKYFSTFVRNILYSTANEKGFKGVYFYRPTSGQ